MPTTVNVTSWRNSPSVTLSTILNPTHNDPEISFRASAVRNRRLKRLDHGTFTRPLVLQTDTLTHSLTPCSTVLLEKQAGSQLVKILPAFYATRRFITAFTSARHLSLSSASSIQSIPPTSHFLKIHLNNTHQPTPRFPRWSLSLRFPHQNPIYASPLPHTCCMPRQSQSSRFYHPHNIR